MQPFQLSLGGAEVPLERVLRRVVSGLVELAVKEHDRGVAQALAPLVALASITGSADLLGTLPAIAHDPTASTYLNMIVVAAASVATKVRRLQGIVRLDQTETPPGPDRPVLNMERSTTPRN